MTAKYLITGIIHKENLLKLNDIKDDDTYLLEKLLAWQTDFDWVEWEDFKENWRWCTNCDSYTEGQCICYAR